MTGEAVAQTLLSAKSPPFRNEREKGGAPEDTSA
jgi:hypothetical protein